MSAPYYPSTDGLLTSYGAISLHTEKKNHARYFNPRFQTFAMF
jgi:hypothetical protein